MKRAFKSLLMSAVIVNGAFACESDGDEKNDQLVQIAQATQQPEAPSWAAIVSRAEAESIRRPAQLKLAIQPAPEIDAPNQEASDEYVNDQLAYIQGQFADYIEAQCKKRAVEAWHESITNAVNPKIQHSLARKHKLSPKQTRRIGRMIMECIKEAAQEKTAQRNQPSYVVEEAMDSRKDARRGSRRTGTVHTKLAQHVLNVRSVALSARANGSTDFAKQEATEKVKLIKHLARQHKNTLKTRHYARAYALIANPALPEVTDIDQI